MCQQVEAGIECTVYLTGLLTFRQGCIKSVGEKYQGVREYHGCGEEYVKIRERESNIILHINIKAAGKNIKGEGGR